jgi:hypothetical protein
MFVRLRYNPEMDSCRRLQIFESYRTHPWLKKAYAKLKSDEIALAHGFIKSHTNLDKASFEKAINRMFLDTPVKPKNWTVINELLTCANSALPR